MSVRYVVIVIVEQLVIELGTLQTRRRSDLVELVGLSPSGITRLLLPLEKIGRVEKERNPRDARVSLVILSEAM
ncbi:MAG: MarR family transcriptional regulator [Rheinheimera sp.]|nr:MarR family transcriptional regulator [Rheinheimera sp.]